MKKYFMVYLASLLLQALAILVFYLSDHYQVSGMPTALYAVLSFLLMLGGLVTLSGFFVSIYQIWRYLEEDSLIWFLGVLFAPIFVIPVFLYRAAYQKSPFGNDSTPSAEPTVSVS